MTGVSDALVGHVLGGRYEILTKLARGGMATVYRARDQRLGRTVAVKVMRSDLGEDPEFVAKFDREARAAAKLSHPNVVGVFDQGNEGGRPYIVMEYVEGHTLRFTVAKESPMPPERVLDLAESVVAALAAAHEAGLVHRDIKPENVLISRRGEVKVADFGLARVMAAPSMTATGVLVGTASYLPPELVTKAKPDARSDVYSLGVMLYEMLTGRKPHTGETNYQIAYAHVNIDIPTPSQALREAGARLSWRIPDYVDALVQACTRRNPEQRPKDGRELLQWLRRARRALALGLSSDADLASGMTTPDVMPTETIAPVTPSPASAVMRPAPVTVERIWRPREATARTPRSSSSPPTRTTATPIFPTHISQDPVHKRRRGVVLLIGIVLAAVLSGYGSWWLVSGRYTAVPATMIGISKADAETVAAETGLYVTFQQEHSETVPAGSVARTEPAAGDRIVRGSTVTAWISLGPERYEMPPVVGLLLADATTAINRANLTVGKVTESWSDSVASGYVMSAAQDKGAKLKKSTAVDLVVSKGPQPIKIPSVVGEESSTAKSKLSAAGFVVTESSEHHSSVPAGKVISQDPASGEGKKGDEVKLLVSKGPVMVEVPQVRYSAVAEAKRKLEEAGFKVEVKDLGGPFRLGIAAGTNPAGGEMAPEGSTITLHVR